MSSISKTLKDNMHSAGIIKTNFYNYFYKVFYSYPEASFIGTTSRLIPYFEELKKHIMNNNYSTSINVLKNYNTYEQSIKEEQIEDLLELLQDIYHELFLDNIYSIPCTASGYISSSDMQIREKDKVKNIYEINNFLPPEENTYPLDHISIEMLYMQQINALFVKFLEEENKDKLLNILQEQYNFLQAHILTWINEFTVYLKEQITQPESNLYYAVSGIMNEFVKYDKKLTEEFLNTLKSQE